MKKHAWNIQDAPAKQASFPGAKLGDANTDEQTSKEKRDGTSEDTFNMSSLQAALPQEVPDKRVSNLNKSLRHTAPESPKNAKKSGTSDQPSNAYPQRTASRNSRRDSQSPVYQDDHSTNTHDQLYKTELCRTFTEKGYCRYGAKCQFAHGLGELRQVQRHPRYKTEICNSYHQTGTCRYGHRCRFIHISPEEDARLSLGLSDDESLDEIQQKIQSQQQSSGGAQQQQQQQQQQRRQQQRKTDSGNEGQLRKSSSAAPGQDYDGARRSPALAHKQPSSKPAQDKKYSHRRSSTQTANRATYSGQLTMSEGVMKELAIGTDFAQPASPASPVLQDGSMLGSPAENPKFLSPTLNINEEPGSPSKSPSPVVSVLSWMDNQPLVNSPLLNAAFTLSGGQLDFGSQTAFQDVPGQSGGSFMLPGFDFSKTPTSTQSIAEQKQTELPPSRLEFGFNVPGSPDQTLLNSHFVPGMGFDADTTDGSLLFLPGLQSELLPPPGL